MESFKLKKIKTSHQKQGMPSNISSVLKQWQKGNKNNAFFCEPAVLQNNIIKNDQIGYKQGKCQESNQNLVFLKFIFVGMLISQFSIQVSVLLIQYIASKINFYFFLIFTILLVVLTLFILVPLRQVGSQIFYHHGKVKPQMSKMFPNVIYPSQIAAPTVLKIRNQAEGRGNQKTLKLNSPVGCEKKENIQTKTRKNLGNSQMLNKNSTNEISKIRFCQPLSFIVVFKLLHNIVAFIVATICFTNIQNPSSVGINLVSVLLILIYILLLLSTIALKILADRNSQGEQLKLKENSQLKQIMPMLLEVIEPQKTNTVLSIEQYVHSNISQQSHKAKSIKNIPENNHQIINPQPSQPKNRYQLKMIEQTAKIQIVAKSIIHKKPDKIEVSVNDELSLQKLTKKSLLKKSKSFKDKGESIKKDKFGGEYQMERRKVEINSQKNEQFLYSELSPANSSRGEDDQSLKRPAKGAEKSKFAPKSRYQKQRMISEAKILQTQRQQNLRRRASKSSRQVPERKKTSLNKSNHLHFQESNA